MTVRQEQRADVPKLTRWGIALALIKAAGPEFADPTLREDDPPELVLAHETLAAERAASDNN
jgi:hypothetical protein